MSASTPKVKASSGVVALIVMIAVVILGYAAYLESTHKALDFQAEALSPHFYMFKPHAVVQLIASGGYVGTLVAVLVEVKWTHRSRQFFSEFKLRRLLPLQLVGAAP
ncbi:hypothetical protein [Pseudomonas putida]|uniref:hypothetical protein n=1 Tax=Pseudomonas putida TaxID=303 RepID=UPI00288ACC69|nr:hypothetical protein [Pseudomonas putida]WNI11362.1 hypothetical protein RIF00_30345 [Pseudomonas putida]